MTSQWDPELLEGFFEEAREDLAGLEPRLVELRSQPNEESIVHQAFRTVHSIKGNSGFFGIKNVNAFADRFENLLDHLRSHIADVNPHVVDLLLRGVDQIRTMLGEAQQTGKPVATLTSLQQTILDEIPGLTAASRIEVPAKVIRKLDTLIRSEGYATAAEQNTVLAELRSLIQTVCSPDDKSAPKTTEPAIANSQVYWGERDVTQSVRELDEWIQACERGESRPLPSAALDGLGQANPGNPDQDAAFEKFREVAELLYERELATDPILGADLREQFNGLTACLTLVSSEPGAAEASPEPAATSASKTSKPTSDPSDHKATVRVGQVKIDQLLASVGKLILTLKNYSVLEDRLEAIPAAGTVAEHLKTTNLQFDEVLHALQGDALSLRRVSSDTLLRTVPRMCTELAEKLQKKVRVETFGDDIEADRSTLDLLKDPLTHILRNSLDHGLETPEQRRAAGKPECGTVRISASVDKQYYTVTVEDDGRGIDADRVRAKAIEKGLITPAQAAALQRNEVLNLVFAPGLSTAAQQTDVSGRGVGMDVVLRNVTEAGGKATVDSTPGHGTTLKLHVPLSSTLMVTEALLVEIAGRCYFVPNAFVQTVMRRDGHATQRSVDGQELVVVDGSILNLVRSAEVLGHATEGAAIENPYWIVVRKGGLALCLEVDHIRGIEEIVVTDLSSVLGGVECVDGAAFTREGEIALVLSIPWILRPVSTSLEETAGGTARLS